MTDEQIKKTVEGLYKKIRDSENKIDKIRTMCPHTEKKAVSWAWKIGHSEQAYVCVICGAFIGYVSKQHWHK